MKMISTFIVTAILLACAQKQAAKKHIPVPKAKQLYDSAKIAAQYESNYEHAILLLDQATQIDKNFYAAYNIKLRCQRSLRRFDDAIVSAKNLVRIGSNNPDTYTTYGILLDKIAGDSLQARVQYEKAIEKIDEILDTMQRSNIGYDFLLTTKGVNLVLLGQPEKARKLWKSQQQETPVRTRVFSNQMGKTREQLIYMFFWEDSSNRKDATYSVGIIEHQSNKH